MVESRFLGRGQELLELWFVLVEPCDPVIPIVLVETEVRGDIDPQVVDR
jgi:hypothetical protein